MFGTAPGGRVPVITDTPPVHMAMLVGFTTAVVLQATPADPLPRSLAAWVCARMWAKVRAVACVCVFGGVDRTLGLLEGEGPPTTSGRESVLRERMFPSGVR